MAEKVVKSSDIIEDDVFQPTGKVPKDVAGTA